MVCIVRKDHSSVLSVACWVGLKTTYLLIFLLDLVACFAFLDALFVCRKHGSSFAGIFEQVDDGESAERYRLLLLIHWYDLPRFIVLYLCYDRSSVQLNVLWKSLSVCQLQVTASCTLFIGLFHLKSAILPKLFWVTVSERVLRHCAEFQFNIPNTSWVMSV